MRFKIGDKVKILQDCSGCFAGHIYILERKNEGGSLRAGDGIINGCSCRNNWLLIKDIDVRKLNKDIIKPVRKSKVLKVIIEQISGDESF